MAERPTSASDGRNHDTSLALDRAGLRALADAATEGPWEVSDANEGTQYGPMWMVTNDAFHNPPADDDEPWLAVELHTGVKADAEFIAAARTAVPRLLDALDEAERDRDEAHEKGYWVGFAEGKDEAETRDLSFDGLTDRAEKAEAEVQRLREGIKALADEYDADATQEGYGGELWTTTARRLRALLDGAR